MTEEIFESQKEEIVVGAKPKRAPGRPRKETSQGFRVDRRNRVPVSGDRDILTIKNQDPNYHYRWVLDRDERGTRIMKFLRAGYDFVRYDEGIEVGDDMVYASDNVGTIVRYANSDGRFLFLMKIPMEFHEDDLEIKHQEIDEIEESIKNPKIEGKYGSVKIGKFGDK